MPAARRFPPPWMIDEQDNACFIVRDATGQALGPERAWAAGLGHQPADQRRGPPHGGELHQAAGAGAPEG